MRLKQPELISTICLISHKQMYQMHTLQLNYTKEPNLLFRQNYGNHIKKTPDLKAQVQKTYTSYTDLELINYWVPLHKQRT